MVRARTRTRCDLKVSCKSRTLPQQIIGNKRESEAPAELTMQRFGRSLTLAGEMQAIPKESYTASLCRWSVWPLQGNLCRGGWLTQGGPGLGCVSPLGYQNHWPCGLTNAGPLRYERLSLALRTLVRRANERWSVALSKLLPLWAPSYHRKNYRRL